MVKNKLKNLNACEETEKTNESVGIDYHSPILPQSYFQKMIQSHDTIEKVQQSITMTLQQIDKNISSCHLLALNFYSELSKYNIIQNQINDVLSVRYPKVLFKYDLKFLLLS